LYLLAALIVSVAPLAEAQHARGELHIEVHDSQGTAVRLRLNWSAKQTSFAGTFGRGQTAALPRRTFPLAFTG